MCFYEVYWVQQPAEGGGGLFLAASLSVFVLWGAAVITMLNGAPLQNTTVLCGCRKRPRQRPVTTPFLVIATKISGGGACVSFQEVPFSVFVERDEPGYRQSDVGRNEI